MCKTTLSSDESKFEILFGTHGRHNLQTKEERRYLGCYQCSVQKPAVLMVSRCIGVYGIDSLHIWNAHQCFPKTSFSGKALHLSASYSKLHSVAIMALQQKIQVTFHQSKTSRNKTYPGVLRIQAHISDKNGTMLFFQKIQKLLS